MKKHINLSCLCLFLLAKNAMALDLTPAMVKEVSPYTSHVNVMIEGVVADPENCGRGDIYRIDYDVSADAKISVLLAAMMADKKVVLDIGGVLI